MGGRAPFIPTRILADPFLPSASSGLEQVKVYAGWYHSADIPLDAWLRHALHQSFGTIIGEPLPAELERLASGVDAV